MTLQDSGQATLGWVLHADNALVAVDKPAGLPSVPARDPTLPESAMSRVRAVHADALVVHRLDMDTSGLLLFALGAAAQRAVSAAFERREVDKVYVAVVDGEPPANEGLIDLPLGADWPRRPRQKVDPAGGRSALTAWRVLARGPGRTRLELRPRTGRSHQLRVHLAAIGHPILGDRLYAHEAARAASARLLLHACSVTLQHPFAGHRLALHCAPPF